MKIHHLRNATFIIEAGENIVLVDPMLGKVGSIPPFSLIRFKAKKNPIISLPSNCLEILKRVTHCVITHKHPDHIDTKGVNFLIKNNIPITCSKLDEKYFNKKGLNVTQSLDYWVKEYFLGGSVTGIPARHGYGFIASPMGNVMGFYIELPNTPSVYISADTIYTNDVDKVLQELKPDLSVVASGSAQLDIGKPLLMHLDDIVKFAKNAPNKVFANHLEALNHCPTTRKALKERLIDEGLINKVFIPNDGDRMELRNISRQSILDEIKLLDNR